MTNPQRFHPCSHSSINPSIPTLQGQLVLFPSLSPSPSNTETNKKKTTMYTCIHPRRNLERPINLTWDSGQTMWGGLSTQSEILYTPGVPTRLHGVQDKQPNAIIKTNVTLKPKMFHINLIQQFRRRVSQFPTSRRGASIENVANQGPRDLDIPQMLKSLLCSSNHF